MSTQGNTTQGQTVSRGDLQRAKLSEQAYVELIHTGNMLAQRSIELFRAHGITTTQYNVLRILRGSSPDTLTCGQISERMITFDSDITRLLDRLEHHGYVQRQRDVEDRRIVRVALTTAGAELLAKIDHPLQEFHLSNFQQFTDDQLRQFIETAKTAREK